MVNNESLNKVQQYYHDNQYLSAWECAQSWGPIESWNDVETLLIGGRLIRNLGAGRKGRVLHTKAWRLAPDHPEAIYYMAWAWHDIGPWQAWRFARKYGELRDASAESRADWFAFLSQVSGDFRDFDAAEKWMERALEICPDRGWLHTTRSYLLSMEDRNEEALASAHTALAWRPYYRPAVQHAAHILTLLGRDAEAIALLNEATVNIQCGSIWGQLGGIHAELGDHALALECYQRYAELSPLLDKYGENSLRAILANQHYLNCDIESALDLSKKVEYSTFFAAMAQRLETLRAEPEKNSGLKRVQLPVEFVRQHHMTCAPATISALARFWSRPVDHLELADEICYDGTPHHSERNWAQRNGWIAEEFTVDWDTTLRLIDRGVPFTVTTVETTSAHLQAIIGYDQVRETILIRDPYNRNLVEFDAKSFFERYQSTGPRGMVLVPPDRAQVLNGITLPDSALYTHLHEMSLALKEHRRENAQASYDALEREAPSHPLTLRARRSLAGYDGDQAGALAAVERMLERFPQDAGLVMAKLSLLHHFNRRDERIALLNEVCALTPARNTEDKGKGIYDPVFWEMLARELRADARDRDQTLWLVRRCIRWRPGDAAGYHLLAGEYWDMGRFDEAIELYRFAACLRDKEEHYQQAYFNALRCFKREETALELLRSRVQRWGAQNSMPAQTLSWAYNQLDRSNEAEATLEEALKLHQTDGELLLYVAREYAFSLKRDRSAQLLESAKGKSSPGSWLRTAAHLARLDGNLSQARQMYAEILEREPLAIDAHRALTRIVAELEGVQAGIAVLRAATLRFPACYPLHQLLSEWLRDDPAEQERVLCNLLQIHPADGWAHREQATALRALHRLDEAEAAARHAIQLEPRNSAGHGILAEILLEKGDVSGAIASNKAALEIAVDNDHAINVLMRASTTTETRRASLQFIHEQLVKQTIFGDSLLSYRFHASNYLDAEIVLSRLKEANAARPDLWQSWSVLVRHLVEMNRLEEAETVARNAATRFSLLPRIWVDLAEVYRLKGDRANRESALQQALAIHPSWSFGLRSLAQIYEDELNYAEARKILETACARDPLDAYNQVNLASVLWKMNERESAIARMQNALKIDNSNQWAWDCLRTWGENTGRPSLAVDLARKLTESRPGDAQTWLTLARTIPDIPDTINARVAALDRALALEPRTVETHDLKATFLTHAARFAEALSACNAPVWNGDPPFNLQGRAAWVQAAQGNKPRAIEMIRTTLEREPQYIWGWHRLSEWCDELGDMKGSLHAAESIVRLLPSEAQSYGRRAAVRLQMGDRAGSYEDLERALKITPDYLFAGRRLTDLYLEDGKWEEAERIIGVMRAHAPTDGFTIARMAQLDARRRRLDRLVAHVKELLELKIEEDWPLETTIDLATQFGQFTAVLKLLEETTKKDPDYYRGWQSYANLLQDNPLRDGYLESAKNMVRLRPQSYLPYGYLGFAYKARGLIKEAMAAYEDALKCDPRYSFASNCLFDHYEANDAVNALRILNVMLAYTPEPDTYLRAIRFYCKQKEENQALDAFQRLLRCNDASNGAIKPALDTLVNASYARRAVDVFKSVLSEENVPEACGRAWIQWLSENKDSQEIDRTLDKWDWSRPYAAEGVIEYMRGIVSTKNEKRFKAFIQRHRERVRANDRMWGMAGWAYYELSTPNAVVEWMNDWKSRPNATPAALLNLASSARDEGEDALAHDVSLQACSRSIDNTTLDHEVWLAWDDAREGNIEAARKRLAATDFIKLRDYYKALHLLAQALCEMPRLKDSATRPSALDTIRTCMLDAEKSCSGAWKSKCLARFAVHVYAQATSACPSIRTWWWRIEFGLSRTWKSISEISIT